MSLRRLSKFSPKPTGAGLVNLSKPRLRMADGGEGLSTADRIARTRQATYQVKQGDPVVMSQGLPTSYPSNTDLFMNSVDRGLTSVGNGLRGMVGAAPRQAPDIQAQAMAVNKMFAPVEPTLRQPMQPVEAPPEIRFNDGGSVPGRGEGDKVPALYEPGEFVVSNDMLDAAPSLRGELRSLRTQVLAKKGMTPEEADEKAMGGGTLRANTGYEVDQYGIPTKPHQTGMGPASSVAPQAGVGTPGDNGSGNSGGSPAVAPEFFPALRGTQAAIASDIQNNRDKGNYAGVVGNLLTALPRYGKAAVDDVIANPLRTINNAASRPTAGVLANVAAGAAGAELSPETQVMFAPSTPASPSALDGFKLRQRQGGMPSASESTPAPIPDPTTPAPEPTLSLRGAQGRQVGDTGAYRFDVEGKSPVYTDKAGLADTDRMLSRPAMPASDPGMQGIQARQDGRMQSLRQKLQYDQEVAAADKVNEAGRRMNLEYGARRGNRQDARTLASMDATAAADKGNAVTLRGQDMKLQGEMYQADGAARSAAAKGKYDSLRDERTYRDGRTDKTFEQRQSARKAMDERIATKFVDKEGKPDIARAADYKDSVTATLAALAAEARAKGDTAKADRLAAADYSNMDSEDEAMIQQLFDAKQSAKSNASWYNGKFVDDKNLLSYRPEGIRKNTVMSNNVRTQNGTELNVNDARDQGLFGGPGSSNLDTYLAQAQQLEAQRLRTQGR